MLRIALIDSGIMVGRVDTESRESGVGCGSVGVHADGNDGQDT